MTVGTAAAPANAILWPRDLVRVVGLFIMAGLSAQGTASTYRPYRRMERTIAAPDNEIEPRPQLETTASAVLEIRRLSGLTWEELSDLFDVSRRSLHHWANGKALSAQNDQLVRRVLSVLRAISGGVNSQTRAFLLTSDDVGTIPLELLKNGKFEEVLSRASTLEEVTQKPVGYSLDAIRRPPLPVSYLDAIQDRPELPSKGRVARSVRVNKRK